MKIKLSFITHSILFACTLALFLNCSSKNINEDQNKNKEETRSNRLSIRIDEEENIVSVFRGNSQVPIVTQVVKEDFRPYIHPILAPDGNGEITEYSPGHHKHQTGIYWGYTRVNGRDYFHNPQGDYWKRNSVQIIDDSEDRVQWESSYSLLDEKGNTLLIETQKWAMQVNDSAYYLDIEWHGEAQTDITIGKYDYGGLFLRMPWREGMAAEVVNAARQRNEKAEGQPAMWIDVGMQLEGRDDFAHIAVFDHPENHGYPQTWRVDGQMGVGHARSREADWQIKKGETEVIKQRLKIYIGQLNDIELTEDWKDYTGQQSLYSTAALWSIAQQEGREAVFLTPDKAIEAMTVKEGYNVNVWASEPMMKQPMAFCWDDKGRLWIAENNDYEARGHGFSNSGDSRILILEDTNGDGKADKSKVFMEGLAFPAAIAVGFDGVFIGAPPNLLFVPDKNGDDKADMDDIKVLLTGWGIRDRHETLNSLHWGPDGWLYGLQGFATPSKVRKPNGKGRLYKHNDPFPEDILESEGVDINGGVWRYHPVKDEFEVVAHGFSNPWGIDYDAKGQLFISACVIPHLWHVVPGGIYHRQGGQHFNPYVYNDIKTIADHSHRSAHGGARIYNSDAFPSSEHGRIFMANIHEHAVLSDVLIKKGSGFVGQHGDDFMMANNAQWVGFSMEIGPDGALYVLDWHDADICGQEVLNKETGRIFRIAPEKSLAENFTGRYSDLTKMTSLQLTNLQTSKSDWHARRARVILQSRASKGKLETDAHDKLTSIYQSHENPDYRLRAFWALQTTNGLTPGKLLDALKDKDEYIRSWAIQFLLEDSKPSNEALAMLARMSREDPSPVVRLYLASGLQRLGNDARMKIAEGLVMHEKDANDHNLPKMIWFGVEPIVAENPSAALNLAVKSKIPMVAKFIARRTVDADELNTLIAKIGQAPANMAVLLEGMREGMEGRYDLTAPENWEAVYTKLKKSDTETARLATEIAQQFGDTEAARKQLATLKDKNTPLNNRRMALLSLANQQRAELIKELPQLIDEKQLRIDAIRAVAAFEDERLGKLLINQYPKYNAEEKLEAVQALASRPRYGWLLAQAIKDQSVPKRDVPAYVARQLRRVVGSGFVEIWGPIDELPAKENAAYGKYKKLLSNEALANANVHNGKVLFQRTCGSCHKMYGEGGTIGPDITGSNRTNIDYLLSNVLNPSDEIQDDYKMVVITTRDGRTYSGNVTAENERQVTLRVVGQDAVIINKSNIQSREVTEVSMMPPGLFDTLTDKEVIDLVGYLRTNTEIQ